MRKYDAYKDSGIEYLGMIPSHWNLMRNKDIAFINSASLNNNTNPLYEFKYIDIGNVNQNGIINEPELVNFYESPSRARRIITENDVIVSTVRTYLRAVAFINFVPKDYIVSTGFAVLSPFKIINPTYLAYYCRSDFFIDLVIKNSKGVSYPAINASELICLSILFPNNIEQNVIAHYLGTTTQAIDKKLNLLEDKICYYKELRKSIINETVTKGLNKNVKLKDSGINYISSIPKHWEIQRVKNKFKIERGRVISQEELIEDGLYAVYSSQTENNGCLGYINTFDFNKDLLTWTTDGANAGTIFRRKGKFNCTNICGTLTPIRKDLDLDYIVYSLQESATHNKRIDTNGAKIMSNEMAIIHFAFPPKSEQTEIATYLNYKTNKHP